MLLLWYNELVRLAHLDWRQRMTHKINITLTDSEYNALAAEAQKIMRC